MSAPSGRRGRFPQRLLAILAGATATILASVATIPAAFASVAPGPERPGRVVTSGGMPGWQTALIALGAVLLVAVTVALLDRALATRRAAAVPSAAAPAASAPAAAVPAASARAA
jgi:hypothetical protein